MDEKPPVTPPTYETLLAQAVPLEKRIHEAIAPGSPIGQFYEGYINPIAANNISNREWKPITLNIHPKVESLRMGSDGEITTETVGTTKIIPDDGDKTEPFIAIHQQQLMAFLGKNKNGSSFTTTKADDMAVDLIKSTLTGPGEDMATGLKLKQEHTPRPYIFLSVRTPKDKTILAKAYLTNNYITDDRPTSMNDVLMTNSFWEKVNEGSEKQPGDSSPKTVIIQDFFIPEAPSPASSYH